LWFPNCEHRLKNESLHEATQFKLAQTLSLGEKVVGEFCGVEIFLRKDRKTIHHTRPLVRIEPEILAKKDEVDWEIKGDKLRPTSRPTGEPGRLLACATETEEELVRLAIKYFQNAGMVP
jgi:hypothetical protein